MRLLVVAVLAAGCVRPTEKLTCGEFSCGVGSVCSPDGTRCVSPETVNACRDLADGDRCTFTGVPDGVCMADVCVPGGCGNGILEPALGEVCDDGNFVSGDGCRGDCLSAEACGDGIQDLAAGELCDCGTAAAPVAGCNGPNSQLPGATCREDCRPGRCGDSVVDAPDETCDDGNTIAGDGCNAQCTGRWTVLESNTLAMLESVWAASATEAWTVGGSHILHWNGATWSELDAPPTAVATATYKSVCGTSSTNVFVVANDAAGTGSQVFRYVGAAPGGAWTEVTPAGVRWNTVECTNTTAWLGGNTSAMPRGRVAQWNGTGFTNLGSFGELQYNIFDVWLSTEGDLYVADEVNQVLKYTPTLGALWTLVNGNGAKVAGTTNNDITTITFSGISTRHYDGSSWTLPQNATELTEPRGLHAIPGSTMLVGRSGAVMVCDAGLCQPSRTGSTADFQDAFQLDTKQAFIVGTAGTILY